MSRSLFVFDGGVELGASLVGAKRLPVSEVALDASRESHNPTLRVFANSDTEAA